MLLNFGIHLSTILVSFTILMFLFGIVVPFAAVPLLNVLDKGLIVSWGDG